MRHASLALALGLVSVLSLHATRAAAADTDAEFVKEVASAGMLEVELGRHASQHAASSSVRAFGQRMVADHTKANTELTAIAKREGLSVPTQMSEDDREEVAKLSKLSGAEFDDAYMKAMVDGHDHVVEEFREQAKESKSEVDRWAAKTVPTLEAHLAQARTVNDGLKARAPAAGAGDYGDEPGAMPGGARTTEPAQP
jgi:putative membrane protein